MCKPTSFACRVAADERHRHSVLLSIELIAERMFDQWSMGHIEGQMKTADIKAPLLALRRLDRGSQPVAALLRAFRIDSEVARSSSLSLR